MFVFGVILVHIFPYSVRMRENADQNNSEYGHFLRSTMFSFQKNFKKKSLKHTKKIIYVLSCLEKFGTRVFF